MSSNVSVLSSAFMHIESGLIHRVSISNALKYPSRIFVSDFSCSMRIASTSLEVA